MEIVYSFLAGAIQGLSEFLPISSSGHLVLFHHFFKFDFPDNLAFDVALHLGTLTALLVYFFSDVKKYLGAFFQSVVAWDLPNNKDQLLAWYLVVATVPAAIAGFFLENTIEFYFRNPILVAVMLIVFGLALYWADGFFEKTKRLMDLRLSGALLIGLAQILALIPGVSRSGITIIAGLTQKLQRDQAARFSFLLSMPIIFGAGVKKLPALFTAGATNGLVLAVGFLSSAIVGYLVVKYFMKYLQRHSLKVFVYYRIVLGLAVFAFVLLS